MKDNIHDLVAAKEAERKHAAAQQAKLNQARAAENAAAGGEMNDQQRYICEHLHLYKLSKDRQKWAAECGAFIAAGCISQETLIGMSDDNERENRRQIEDFFRRWGGEVNTAPAFALLKTCAPPFTEWVREHGTERRPTTRQAIPPTPVPQQNFPPPAPQATPPRQAFQHVTFGKDAQASAELPKPIFDEFPFLWEGSTTLFCAPPNCGKSTLMRVLIKKLNEAGIVVFVVTEELIDRWWAQQKIVGVDESLTATFNKPPNMAELNDTFADARRQWPDKKIVFIADTAKKMFGQLNVVSEIKNEDVKAFFDQYKPVIQHHNVCGLLFHHVSIKKPDNPDAKPTPLGATAWAAECDDLLMSDREKGERMLVIDAIGRGCGETAWACEMVDPCDEKETFFANWELKDAAEASRKAQKGGVRERCLNILEAIKATATVHDLRGGEQIVATDRAKIKEYLKERHGSVGRGKVLQGDIDEMIKDDILVRERVGHGKFLIAMRGGYEQACEQLDKIM